MITEIFKNFNRLWATFKKAILYIGSLKILSFGEERFSDLLRKK